MKRFLTVVLALVLLLAPAATVYADVAWVPQNDFLEKHMDDCSYVNRLYYTNGASGFALVWSSPVGDPVQPIPNGRAFLVSWVYSAGSGSWGCIEYDPDTLESAWSGASGWVKLEELAADYDKDAFYADHAAEIRTESRILEPEADSVIQLYKYPGSGEVVSTLDAGWLGDGGAVQFNQLFTDPAGRDWGYLGYLYGQRNAWICLDDPYNPALEPDENCVTLRFVDAGVETSPQTSTIDDGKYLSITAPADQETLEQVQKSTQKPGIASLAGAGGVVVIALAVLVEVFRRRRMKKY